MMAGKPSALATASVLVAALATAALAQPAPARRIVSLVPAVTEMLFAMGAGAQVVAVSSFDSEPPEVERLPRVGALLDPDLERILSLRPDLVVIYATQDDLRTQFARTGTPVFPYRHAGLNGIYATLRGLGERTGRVDAADGLVRRLEADLARVRARVVDRPKPAVLLVFGRDPGSLRHVFASGGVGFLHEVLELAGGTNVLGDVKKEAVQVSVEQILAKRPEVILELSADGEAAPASDAERAWQALRAVPAVRDRRVHAMRGSELVVPGPRIAQAAERIARTLHPAAGW